VRIELPDEEICRAYLAGTSVEKLAAEYEVSTTPIRRILGAADLLPGARTGRPHGSRDSDPGAAESRSHGQRLRRLREKAGLLDEEASRRCTTCGIRFTGTMRSFLRHRIKCTGRVDSSGRFQSKALPG
jgi:hypothetical protein